MIEQAMIIALKATLIVQGAFIFYLFGKYEKMWMICVIIWMDYLKNIGVIINNYNDAPNFSSLPLENMPQNEFNKYMPKISNEP